jgi:hypothetical protein
MVVKRRGIKICVYEANSPEALRSQHLGSVGANPTASNAFFHSAKCDRVGGLRAIGENEKALH